MIGFYTVEGAPVLTNLSIIWWPHLLEMPTQKWFKARNAGLKSKLISVYFR